MSRYASIRQEIANYLQTHHRVALDEISAESTLEDVGIDSLGVLEIATLLENKHGLCLETGQMIQMRTFSDLMELVKAKSSSPA